MENKNEFTIISENLGVIERRLESCESFIVGEKENELWSAALQELRGAVDHVRELEPAWIREFPKL